MGDSWNASWLKVLEWRGMGQRAVADRFKMNLIGLGAYSAMIVPTWACRLGRCALAVALICSLLGWSHLSTAQAADFEIRDEGWNGCSDLWRLARGELSPLQVHVVPNLNYGDLQPGDGILFLHPLTEIHFHSLAAFLGAGGRAAVLDDFGAGDSLLGKFHVRRGGPPVEPRWLAQGETALPIARPHTEHGTQAAAHPILRHVKHVVTNRPSTLLPDADIELTPLLEVDLLDGTRSLFAATGVIGDVGSCGLAAGTSPGAHCGRLVAVADASVFINLMLRYAGNRSFAKGLIRYLVAADTWGPRNGNLYILTGAFSQSGSFGDAPNLADKIAERRAKLRRWLVALRTEPMSAAAAAFLALLIGMALALWAALIAGRNVGVLGARFSQAVPLQEQGGFAGRYASLAANLDDRAMLLLEMQRTFEANLRMKLGLEEAVSREEIRRAAMAAGCLSSAGDKKLQRLMAKLATGEVAILSGRRLKISDRSLRAMAKEIVDTVSNMSSSSSGSGAMSDPLLGSSLNSRFKKK